MEFLGLRISPWIYHLLSLSVAHKRHGEQMRSGWPQNPKTLADRDASMNNLLIRTKFSNFFKSDYLSKHYPKLREIAKALKVPTEIYAYATEAPTNKITDEPIGADAGFVFPVADPIIRVEMSYEDVQQAGDVEAGDGEDSDVEDKLPIDESEELQALRSQLKTSEQFARNVATLGDDIVAEYLTAARDDLDSGEVTQVQGILKALGQRLSVLAQDADVAEEDEDAPAGGRAVDPDVAQALNDELHQLEVEYPELMRQEDFADLSAAVGSGDRETFDALVEVYHATH